MLRALRSDGVTTDALPPPHLEYTLATASLRLRRKTLYFSAESGSGSQRAVAAQVQSCDLRQTPRKASSMSATEWPVRSLEISPSSLAVRAL